MTDPSSLDVTDSSEHIPATVWRPFGLGFRPFFLLAGLAALTLMLIWLSAWHGEPSAAALYYGHINWHSHEMLFGYAVAIYAGFLLTAARNWTGLDTPSGISLALLVLLWFCGRLAPWIAALPSNLVALVDLAFLPVLAMVMTPVLWPSKNRANRWFIALLLAMTAANALMHAEALGYTATAQAGGMAMLDLLLLLIVFVAGRIVPFFTEMGIKGCKTQTRKSIESASFILLALVAVLHLTSIAPNWLSGGTLIIIGILQLVRMQGWYDKRIWSVPLLWVLHTGYLWLIPGFVLYGASEFGLFQRSAAIHALTVGAIGVFTLGMMARVSLGHTGRSMRTTTLINVAFVMLHIAAVVRVFGPVLMPSWYVSWIMLAGLVWIVVFALFLFVYTPILLKSRIDGRPD